MTLSTRFSVAAVALMPFLVNLSLVLVGLSSWENPPGPFLGGDLPLTNPMTMLGIFVLTMAIVATWLAFRYVTDRAGRARLFALTAYQGVIFAAIWLVLPSWDKDALPWLAGVCALCLVLAFRLAGRPLLHVLDAPGSRAGRFVFVDLAILMVPLLVWWFVRDSVSWIDAREDLLIGLLTYPVYAFMQLLLFLALPARLLQRLGVPGPLITTSLVLGFALLHAPNPALALATGLAMLIWSRQWLLGRKLWAIALVMGLAASLATQLLPDHVTGEMRIGPDYLDHRHLWTAPSATPTG